MSWEIFVCREDGEFVPIEIEGGRQCSAGCCDAIGGETSRTTVGPDFLVLRLCCVSQRRCYHATPPPPPFIVGDLIFV